jgi:hypothetical protein
MIAAGINSKALSTYMGHSSITITLDRYGHLLPGNETQAAQLLDTWLRTNTKPHPRPADGRNATHGASPPYSAHARVRARGGNVRVKGAAGVLVSGPV